MQYSKIILALPALVAVSAFASSAPAGGDALVADQLFARFLDKSSDSHDSTTSTTNDDSQHYDSHDINNSTTKQNKSNTVGDIGSTKGNDGGANSVKTGSITMSCRRAYGLGRRMPGFMGTDKTVTQDSGNTHTSTKTNTNTNTQLDNHSVNNNNSGNSQNSGNTDNSHEASNSGVNYGTIGASNMCQRSDALLEELEERDHLAGEAILSALGARSHREADDPMHILAARDIGVVADRLGVRAATVHGNAAAPSRRAVGLQCGDECRVSERDAEDMIIHHARSLGYVFF